MSRKVMEKLLRVGDRVKMNLDPETRSYGAKAVKNGTLGTVISKTRIENFIEHRNRCHDRVPGIYSFDGPPIVKWDEYPEGVDPSDDEYNIIRHACCLEPADSFTEEYESRYKELWPVRLEDGSLNPDFCSNKASDKLRNMIRTGDLPETEFWEGDYVSYKGEGRYRVLNINYFTWGPNREHCYNIEEVDEYNQYLCNGMLTDSPDLLSLIERGGRWKEAHGEVLSFRSEDEEFDHEMIMGRVKEIRNPKDNFYLWPKDEALLAIEGGIADVFSLSTIPFSDKKHIVVRRFDNREIGERARRKTLAGFNRI